MTLADRFPLVGDKVLVEFSIEWATESYLTYPLYRRLRWWITNSRQAIIYADALRWLRGLFYSGYLGHIKETPYIDTR